MAMAAEQAAGEADGLAAKPGPKAKGPLIFRQSIFTRLTHWVWVIAMFFLLFSGLQIFNAHPNLYIGQQSGFEFDNSVLRIGAENTDAGPRGFTTIFGQKFDTTGVLGMSGPEARPAFVGFPGWATVPSVRDLATGRVVHFFFGWLLVGTLGRQLHLRHLVSAGRAQRRRSGSRPSGDEARRALAHLHSE